MILGRAPVSRMLPVGVAMRSFDIIVIGGGVVGMAVARAVLSRHASLSVAVLEKERALAQHSSGRCSGTLHAGTHVPSNTQAARLCVAGYQAAVRYCEARGIPLRRVGKLILALADRDVPRLVALEEGARANGVKGVRVLDDRDLRRMEPHVRGLAALYSPDDAIVDPRRLVHALAEDVSGRGATLLLGTRAIAVEEGAEGLTVYTNRGALGCSLLVNCAGAFADVLARQCGFARDYRAVPMRACLYALSAQKAALVRHQVVTLPAPGYSFLETWIGPLADGTVEAGPVARLTLGRDAYRWRQLAPWELARLAMFPGLPKLWLRHGFWRPALQHLLRAWTRRAFAAWLRRLLPGVQADDLHPGRMGIRAQLLVAMAASLRTS